jgi:sugar phosphate isomerase/epimerase
VEELGELEVDHAELAGAAVVGDVAQNVILMAHAEGEKGVVDLLHAVGVEVIDALAAVGGDDAQLVGEGFEELWDEVAAALGEVGEDTDLVLEAFTGHVAAESFVHAAIESDADEGAGGIFDLLHEARASVGPKRRGDKPRIPGRISRNSRFSFSLACALLKTA